jgi:hypothetical protein
MEFLAHAYLGILGFLPSILLLFGIYLIWEQSKLLNKQLNGITQLLTAIHQEQMRRDDDFVRGGSDSGIRGVPLTEGESLADTESQTRQST